LAQWWTGGWGGRVAFQGEGDKLPGARPARDPSARGTVSATTLKGTSVVINLHVDDCEKLYKQAVSAGAKASMPLEDPF